MPELLQQIAQFLENLPNFLGEQLQVACSALASALLGAAGYWYSIVFAIFAIIVVANYILDATRLDAVLVQFGRRALIVAVSYAIVKKAPDYMLSTYKTLVALPLQFFNITTPPLESILLAAATFVSAVHEKIKLPFLLEDSAGVWDTIKNAAGALISGEILAGVVGYFIQAFAVFGALFAYIFAAVTYVLTTAQVAIALTLIPVAAFICIADRFASLKACIYLAVAGAFQGALIALICSVVAQATTNALVSALGGSPLVLSFGVLTIAFCLFSLVKAAGAWAGNVFSSASANLETSLTMQGTTSAALAASKAAGKAVADKLEPLMDIIKSKLKK